MTHLKPVILLVMDLAGAGQIYPRVCDWVSRNPVTNVMINLAKANRLQEVGRNIEMWLGFQKPRHKIYGFENINQTYQDWPN